MNILDIVILAAGKGTRMRSSTPKVLQSLAGKPLLAHVIKTAKSLEPRQIYIVVGHQGDRVKNAFEHNETYRFIDQQEQHGTGHALRQVLPFLPEDDGKVLVLYGDVPLIEPATLQTLKQLADDHLIAWLSTEIEDPTGYGRIIRDADGKVSAIVEEKLATAQQRTICEVNSGVFIASIALLRQWLPQLSCANAQQEYLLTDILQMAVEHGIVPAVHCLAGSESYQTEGVNDAWQLVQMERRYQLQAVKALALQQGVRFGDPQRVDIRGTLRVGREVYIDIDTLFIGDVVLGDGVQVGAHCVIANTRIDAGTCIEAFSHVENSIIGCDCNIGPYAHLRPQTVLEPAARVGNFVELKNTRLGSGSKANHLAYIGDTDVGAKVNIGAGTITCNYDGQRKHQTLIEEGVFVGSNSVLIAPLRIGKDAYIGAGSAVSRDVPKGALALERAQQQNLEGWTENRQRKKSRD